MSGISEPNSNPDVEDSEMLEEYDFSQAVRGKYSQRSRADAGKTIVTIDSEEGKREVVIKTVEVFATVTEDGKLTVQLPADISSGEHRIVLLIEEEMKRQSA
jgi:hypothetical protein